MANRLIQTIAFLLLLLHSAIFASTPIKIASWNVENLFDMHRDGTEYEEYTPRKHGWNQAVLEKKLNHLSEVICDLDAKIIALQEVESDRVLALLQKRLQRVGCAYPYRYITHAPPRTAVHVALLSRIRLRQRRDLRIAAKGRYRSILEAILPSTPPLRLFVNHWRSKSGPESERVRYARALKRRLERLPDGSEYLLMGDFNSDVQEFRILSPRRNDTHGVTGINQILGTTLHGQMLRRGDLSHVGKEGRMVHYSLWMELPASQRWSHNFYGKKEALDAILIPPTLLDGKGWEYVRGSFGVYRPSYLFGRYGQILRWEYRHGQHTGRGYSDHLPIYASFENLGSSSKSSTKEPSQKREKRSVSLPSVTIEELNRRTHLDQVLLLKDATVILKRGRSAIVEQDPSKEAILIYAAAEGLREGECYDMKIYGIKRYHGMPEITDLEIVKEKGKVPTDPFYLSFDPYLLEKKGNLSKIVRNVSGVYRHGSLHLRGTVLPLHFKKRRWIPKEGSKIRIRRAQIGYYKDHKELVIWDRQDFENLAKRAR